VINFALMKSDEINVMVQLAQEIWREYSPCFISFDQIEYMLEKFQSITAMREQLENAYQYYFIKKNDKIAGYFAIQPKEDYLFLSKLYIKQEFRGQKIGRQTLEFIKKTAKELNAHRIELTVNKYNENSIKAYNNWGFSLKEEAQFDIGSGYIMDDYVLEYKL